MNVLKKMVGLGETGGSRRRPEESKADIGPIAVPPAPTVAAQDIMDSLPREFYEPDFDPGSFLLQHLPAELSESLLEEEAQRYEAVLNVISSELSHRVLRSYGAFVQGMAQVHELGTDLQLTGVICSNGRRNLMRAKDEIAQGGLTVLTKQKKQESFAVVSGVLQSIAGVIKSQQKLYECLDAADFPTAIKLSLDSRNTAIEYPQYICVKELQGSLSRSYEDIQSRMAQALMDCCARFDAHSYSSALIGYKQLGKNFAVAGDVDSHFRETVDECAKSVVYERLKRSKKKVKKKDRTSLKVLCAALEEAEYSAVLRDVLRAFCDLLYNFHLMLAWHTEQRNLTTENQKYYSEVGDSVDTKSRKSLYDAMQKNLATYLTAVDVIAFKVEVFFDVLDLINEFLTIGDEFSTGGSPTLRQVVRDNSRRYFDNYNRSRIDYLVTIMENETWQPCPVTSTYGVTELKFKMPTEAKAGVRSSFFSSYMMHGNPFDRMPSEKPEITPTAAAAEAAAGEPGVGAADAGAPLVASATISLLRSCAGYVNMMAVLGQAVTADIFTGVTQMVEYYIYVVFLFFGASSEESFETDSSMTPKLRSLLLRLREWLARDDAGSPEAESLRFRLPHISDAVSLREKDTLFALKERIVGVESLLFVAQIFNTIKPWLVDMVPKSRSQGMQDFYEKTLDVIPELREYMYRNVTDLLLRLHDYPGMIGSVKWDVSSVNINNNPFVDGLARDFASFQARLNVLGPVTIPREVNDLLFKCAISKAMTVMVEGFSRTKKCTNEGRAQMALDAQIFKSNCERMTKIRPLPKWALLEGYIKAYYLPEPELINWARDHTEYTPSQIEGLARVCTQLSKRSRQTITEHLKKQEKNYARLRADFA